MTRLAWLLGFVAIVFPFVSIATGIPPEIESQISGAEAYFKRVRDQLSFEFVASSFERGGDLGNTEVQSNQCFGSTSIQDSLYRYRNRERSKVWFGGVVQPSDNEVEIVLSKENRIQINSKYPVQGTEVSSFDLSNFGTASSKVSVIANLPNNSPGIADISAYCGPMVGILGNDEGKNIVDILRLADKVSSTEETLGEEKSIHLSGKSQYGMHHLWLSKDKGYAPLKMICEKTGDDLYAGTPVKAYPPFTNPNDRYPSSQLSSCRYEVRNVKLEKDQDKDFWFVVGYEIEDYTAYQQDDYFSLRSQVTIQNPRLECKDAELLPSIPIPEGTRVYLEDAPRIVAEWRNGRIEKVVDTEALKRFDNLQGPSVGRSGLKIALSILIFVALACGIYFMRTR